MSGAVVHNQGGWKSEWVGADHVIKVSPEAILERMLAFTRVFRQRVHIIAAEELGPLHGEQIKSGMRYPIRRLWRYAKKTAV